MEDLVHFRHHPCLAEEEEEEECLDRPFHPVVAVDHHLHPCRVAEVSRVAPDFHQVVQLRLHPHEEVVVEEEYLVVQDFHPAVHRHLHPDEEMVECRVRHFHLAAVLDLPRTRHQDVVVEVEFQGHPFHQVAAADFLPCREAEALGDFLARHFRPAVDLHRVQCLREAREDFLEVPVALALEGFLDRCLALEDSPDRDYRLANWNRPSQVLPVAVDSLDSEHRPGKAEE